MNRSTDLLIDYLFINPKEELQLHLTALTPWGLPYVLKSILPLNEIFRKGISLLSPIKSFSFVSSMKSTTKAMCALECLGLRLPSRRLISPLRLVHADQGARSPESAFDRFPFASLCISEAESVRVVSQSCDKMTRDVGLDDELPDWAGAKEFYQKYDPKDVIGR